MEEHDIEEETENFLVEDDEEIEEFDFESSQDEEEEQSDGDVECSYSGDDESE